MSNPNPPAPATRAPRWIVWLGVCAIVAYGAFIVRNFAVVAGGSDSSGYLNSARLFAAGKFTTELRVPPEFGPTSVTARFSFLPLGFWPWGETNQINPTYPTGLPLHLALAGKLLGWNVGPVAVGLFSALGTLLLLYAVARELEIDATLAAAGVVALAACPVFLFIEFQPISDLLAATWCLAAFWTALQARRALMWSLACGVAFAIAVLVRPTNIVVGPALLVLLGLDWRRLTLAVLGGLPGVAWLATYNHALYGGALQSGYGDWAAGFAWKWGAPTAWHFLKWLAMLLPAPFVVLPIFGAVRRDARTRAWLALVVWFAAITGVYTFYEVSHEVWWCLRFLLPALPALILAALLGAEALARRRPGALQNRFRQLTALLIAGWAVALAIIWAPRLDVFATKPNEETYREACVLAQKLFPAATLVVTQSFSGALYYYTDHSVLRWDSIETREFTRLAALALKAGRPIGAINFKWDDATALHEKCPGNWTQVGAVKNATLWRLVGPVAQ